MAADLKTSCLNNNIDKNVKNVDFPYPSCWQDNARMKVLMSTFHMRDINPLNYDAKMKFWIDLIMDYCMHFGKVHFCIKELRLKLARGDTLPACLETVIQHMQQQKIIRQRNEFEYDPENTWSGWAVNSFVKKPLSWSWRLLRNSIIKDDVDQQNLVEWVHLLALKNFCNELETKVIEQNRGKLLHFDGFKSICNNLLNIDETGLLFCLRLLHCQQKIGLEYKQEKQMQQVHLIKIPSKENPNIIITESDHAIHNLQMTQTNLLKQLETLEDEIKMNDEKARQYIKENKRQLAKTYLRKRHLLEKNHEKRSIALHNIETLLLSVDEAQNNGVVIDAYKYGSKALQNVLNESGLKYDNVDEVLADVRDTMEQHKEIQDSITNVNLNETVDDELERELREIMGEQENTQTNSALAGHSTPQAMKNNETKQIVITDEELLKMLDGLEVEEHSIAGSNATLQSIAD